MSEEIKDPFCVKKVERLSEREFHFELLLGSGKKIEGKGTLEKAEVPHGAVEIGHFDVADIASHTYSQEIDIRKLVQLMSFLASMEWYDMVSSFLFHQMTVQAGDP